MPVVILCGGEGSRFHEESQYRPKPMAEIGGAPILCHIMRIFSSHGYRRFILCLGYKGGMIKDYFLRYETSIRNFSLRLGAGQPQFLDSDALPDWDISFIDTGAKTMTGARLKQIEAYIDTEHFMVTYGDGVADVDITALVDHHLDNDAIGTVTAVRSRSQFGELRIVDGKVVAFAEKPPVEAMINGGFFVFKRSFFDYLSRDENCVLEREPLTRLAADSNLRCFRHDGFWQCMDTYKDYRLLNELWAAGDPPWARMAGRSPHV